MNAHRLTAPREFVGSVDATHERCTPCPRTLEEAFGRAAGGVIVPMADEPSSFNDAEPYVYVASLIGIVAALVFNNWRPM
ncbi:hypothetical protein [Variovorax paradoxus]|uniref:hypothetical protein n=1 Tax=Variovorax paradoxus TaxID=34073 RepID=UPI001931BC76|nr:hypothetical protein INQ48_18180 [Variovorax paradoxus]